MFKDLLILTPVIAAMSVGPAMAETAFAKAHPRRAEVNHRLRVQTARIHHERKEGEITAAEAKDLHQQDLAIKREERAAVKANGGYLTKEQARDLNKDLNHVSKEIGH